MLFKVAMTNVYDIENENKPKKVLIIVLICSFASSVCPWRFDHKPPSTDTIKNDFIGCAVNDTNAINRLTPNKCLSIETNTFEWDFSIKKNGFNYSILLLNNCTMHWICSRARKLWHNPSNDDPNDNRVLFLALGVKKIASVQNTHIFRLSSNVHNFHCFLLLSLFYSPANINLSKWNLCFFSSLLFQNHWLFFSFFTLKLIEKKKYRNWKCSSKTTSEFFFRLRHRKIRRRNWIEHT